MGVLQTKKLLHSKRKNQENERQCTEWEKIVNHISDKGLISKIYKEPIQFNRENIQFKNWQKT